MEGKIVRRSHKGNIPLWNTAQEAEQAVVDDFILISVKNRVRQMTPNSAMVELCNSAEKSIRSIVKLDPHVIMSVWKCIL